MTVIENTLNEAPVPDERLNETVKQLAELKKALTLASDYLPAYDKRRYGEVGRIEIQRRSSLIRPNVS